MRKTFKQTIASVLIAGVSAEAISTMRHKESLPHADYVAVSPGTVAANIAFVDIPAIAVIPEQYHPAEWKIPGDHLVTVGIELAPPKGKV